MYCSWFFSYKKQKLLQLFKVLKEFTKGYQLIASLRQSDDYDVKPCCQEKLPTHAVSLEQKDSPPPLNMIPEGFPLASESGPNYRATATAGPESSMPLGYAMPRKGWIPYGFSFLCLPLPSGRLKHVMESGSPRPCSND